jgi:lipoyl(octanoyl) transferase
MRQADRSSQELWVCHLGVVPYGDGLAVQEHVRALRQGGELPDVLLLLEHPPTYTRGRRSGAQDLPFGEDFYRAKGIGVHATNRGGKLTYHGPGQLVGYPIMGVTDIGCFLRTMEAAIVDALGQVGIAAHSRHAEGIDYTGVWVGTPGGTTRRRATLGGQQPGERKIASIGVHVSRGVTTHGFAVNVHNDLEPFSWVLACGLPDVNMTSLAREAGTGCESLSCFRKRMAYAFAQAHGRCQRLVSPARLGIDAANATRRAERAPIKAIPSPRVEPVPA